MQRERNSLRANYLAAKPYPHVVMDGFFDEEVLDRIITEFPSTAVRDWIRWETTHERKQTSRGISQLPPFTQMFFLQQQLAQPRHQLAVAFRRRLLRWCCFGLLRWWGCCRGLLRRRNAHPQRRNHLAAVVG